MANQEGSYGYTRDLSSLFDAVTVLVKDYLHQYQDRNSKVVEFHPPHEISQLVDFSLPEEGIKEEDIIEQCKSVLKYSVHTGKYNLIPLLPRDVCTDGVNNEFIINLHIKI